jgi:hypothetical protein
MEAKKYFLSSVAGRDGLHYPALCLSINKELWYLFKDSAGICFRHIKEEVPHDYTVDEIKKKKFGIYREMSHKWNQISSILKDTGQN